MDAKMFYGGEINEDTILYRYMSLNQFVSLIELEEVYLTKITRWEDNWEAPMRFIPAKLSSGKFETPSFSIEDTLYAQCWSKLKNSDALWRIYCKKNDGIMIKTTAGKFELVKDFKRACLGEINYYKEDQLMKQAEKMYNGKKYGAFGRAFLKRDSFIHESEVRFVVCQQDHSENFESGCNNLNFKVNILDFIEGIYIDPRSDDWFVETIKKYSDRKELNIIPEISDLYSDNVYKKNQFYAEYKPIRKVGKE